MAIDTHPGCVSAWSYTMRWLESSQSFSLSLSPSLYFLFTFKVYILIWAPTIDNNNNNNNKSMENKRNPIKEREQKIWRKKAHSARSVIVSITPFHIFVLNHSGFNWKQTHSLLEYIKKNQSITFSNDECWNNSNNTTNNYHTSVIITMFALQITAILLSRQAWQNTKRKLCYYS